MVDHEGQAMVVGRKTLLPVGMVMGAFGVGMALFGMVVTLTFNIATERAEMLADIRAVEQKNLEQDGRLDRVDEQVNYLVQSSFRIEARLGTLPQDETETEK